MPRRPDPTALTPEEAAEVRDLVRRVKASRGLTNEDLADRLGWELHQVTNAMRDELRQGEPNRILARTARDLLKRSASAPGESWRIRLKRGEKRETRQDIEGALLLFWHRMRARDSWLTRLERLERAPAVFVPPWEAEHFAGLVIDHLKSAKAISPKSTASVERALRALFAGSTAIRCAQSWYYTFGPAVQRFIGEVECGERKWQTVFGDPLRIDRRHLGREIVALLVDQTFPAKKEGK